MLTKNAYRLELLPENQELGKDDSNSLQINEAAEVHFKYPLPHPLPQMKIIHVVEKNKIVAWCWVVLWMGTLFSASTDLGSPRHTSRIIGPLLRWLIPDVQPATIEGVQFVVRKTTHAVSYALLAALIWNALRPALTGWNTTTARRSVLIAAIYAATDEVHQGFVPGRRGSLGDVMLDIAGAVLGIFLVWWIGRRAKKW